MQFRTQQCHSGQSRAFQPYLYGTCLALPISTIHAFQPQHNVPGLTSPRPTFQPRFASLDEPYRSATSPSQTYPPAATHNNRPRPDRRHLTAPTSHNAQRLAQRHPDALRQSSQPNPNRIKRIIQNTSVPCRAEPSPPAIPHRACPGHAGTRHTMPSSRTGTRRAEREPNATYADQPPSRNMTLGNQQ
ncbi:hypothetical protein LCGC14_0516710 [marine sediment metagenome]|uniref:Uncharacterized protein n=1 Tax=marine sediment metagenome TaxID=412755 RepID=A0A0F9V808_9ZZZZ